MFTSTVSTEGMDGNAPFLKVDTLVEAEDWVRSLAFTQHDSGDSGLRHPPLPPVC